MARLMDRESLEETEADRGTSIQERQEDGKREQTEGNPGILNETKTNPQV